MLAAPTHTHTQGKREIEGKRKTTTKEKRRRWKSLSKFVHINFCYADECKGISGCVCVCILSSFLMRKDQLVGLIYRFFCLSITWKINVKNCVYLNDICNSISFIRSFSFLNSYAFGFFFVSFGWQNDTMIKHMDPFYKESVLSF